MRMNIVFRMFQVRSIVPSDSLNISPAEKLKYVVCVQSLSRKDGEALRRFWKFDAASVFFVAPL